MCTPALPQDKTMKATPVAPMAASTKGYMAAMQSMDKGMDFHYTGNADIDFVRGMIPHHQGAVDMCKVELQYGKDPQILELCKSIVSSQEGQIVEMKAWLQQHSK
jgi:uncharacterized protein (DUF305 family)